MNFNEKVAYLKGLMEGLGIDENSKEGKMFAAIIDVLDEAALSVGDLEDNVAELNELADELDSDLGALEDEFYGECDCDDCGDIEAVCPSCGEILGLTDDELEEGVVVCPECGEEFEIEFDDCCDCDCDDDCCDCGCED